MVIGCKNYGNDAYIGAVSISPRRAIVIVINKPHHGGINPISKPVPQQRAAQYVKTIAEEFKKNNGKINVYEILKNDCCAFTIARDANEK